MAKYSITTTLPYVNADPHIGFALEIVQADVLARWRRMRGDEVVFNTGTDEHGQKIYKNAMDAGLDPKTYCDGFAARFDGLKTALNLSYTHFIRTTDPHHIAAAQEFWRRCDANGDIYKASYKVRYCVGCELEKTDSELVDGKCAVHPNLELEDREEENYYFRWSKYGERLMERYTKDQDFVMPPSRLKEISAFVGGGLQDFSISRLASKMPWGIPVPGDEAHVMYVWFDALVNYVSTLGWPDEGSLFTQGYWPNVQVAGKDNLRQQSAMWQAMLMSAGLPMSHRIFIHGFITADGQKMSKSLGNVVNPYDLVEKYGTDPVRFFLVSALPAYEDGDFTEKSFEETYTAKLVNGVGNLAARVATMVGKYCDGTMPAKQADIFDTAEFWKTYEAALDRFHFDEAARVLDAYVSRINKTIDQEAPFKKAKEGIDVSPLMYQLAEGVRHVAVALIPVIPAAADRILAQFSLKASDALLPRDSAWGRLEPGVPVAKGDILFSRLEK
jgi:methionyl-tRNA synthetase